MIVYYGILQYITVYYSTYGVPCQGFSGALPFIKVRRPLLNFPLESNPRNSGPDPGWRLNGRTARLPEEKGSYGEEGKGPLSGVLARSTHVNSTRSRLWFVHAQHLCPMLQEIVLHLCPCKGGQYRNKPRTDSPSPHRCNG